MKEPMVITMAREYASGGSEIAQAVADKLGIPLYNKELITLAAKKSGLTEEAIAASENQRSGSLIYSLYMMGNTMPLADQVYILQSNVIKEVASQGSCVILGRCGDYVLRDRPNVLRTFVFAPMVHWPEVMVSYESTEKVLFSADGFGRFGAVAKFDEKADWASEARRYYLNIVGKYGPQVQALLKKAAALDIQTICPLHGPVLQGDLAPYLHLYNTWSSYQPETRGVFIAYASIYGNTKTAALLLAEELKSRGVTVEIADLSRTDLAQAVAKAFQYSQMVCAAPSYDGGVFPVMADFLHHLKSKSYQNRTVALIENGSWAPSAARTMTAQLEEMKAITLLSGTVTVRAALKDADRTALTALADALAQ